MAEYTNGHGEVYTFTKQGIDKVLIEGNFEFHRVGEEPDDIDYIHPSGGPFIKKGQNYLDTARELYLRVLKEEKGNIIANRNLAHVYKCYPCQFALSNQARHLSQLLVPYLAHLLHDDGVKAPRLHQS